MARYAALISTCVAARPTRSASYGLHAVAAAASAAGAARGTAPAMMWVETERELRGSELCPESKLG
nr:unnamed protein product [Digitaria exilis]